MEINFFLTVACVILVCNAAIYSVGLGILNAVLLSIAMRVLRIFQEVEADSYADPECMRRVIFTLTHKLTFESRLRLRMLE